MIKWFQEFIGIIPGKSSGKRQIAVLSGVIALSFSVAFFWGASESGRLTITTWWLSSSAILVFGAFGFEGYKQLADRKKEEQPK